MILNKSELKKVLYDFNSISNRLMKADYQDYNNVLGKFLRFINECEIIRSYIEDCGSLEEDIEDEFNNVVEADGDLLFSLGETTNDEVVSVHTLFQHIYKNNIDIVYTIGRIYSNADTYRDILKDVNERLILVLIRHIEGYLTKIGIDMGLDESVRYNITVTNGQVNVATDNATINATSSMNLDISEIQRLINDIKLMMPPSLSADETESISGSLEIIETELKQDKPRKGVVKSAITALKAIKVSAEFAAAVVTLAQFISSFL